MGHVAVTDVLAAVAAESEWGIRHIWAYQSAMTTITLVCRLRLPDPSPAYAGVLMVRTQPVSQIAILPASQSQSQPIRQSNSQSDS